MAKPKRKKKPLEQETEINITPQAAENDDPALDSEHIEKYKQKSHKLRIFKAVLLLVIVLFLLGGFSIFREDISIDSLRYLFKYFDISTAHISDDTEEIPMDTENSMISGIYKSGIAALKTSSFELYDYSGELIFSDNLSYTNPAMVIGGKYILVYDMGGKNARIYNSFALLWEKTYDYAITAADINDNGYFCIATGEKGYTSATYAYSSSFEETYSWRSGDKFIFDVSYCDGENDLFSAATFKSENGDYTGELFVFNTSESEPLYTENYSGEMIYSLNFVKADCLRLITDLRHEVIDPKNGSDSVSQNFAEGSIKMFCFGNNWSVFAVNESIIGQNNTIFCYDGSGNLSYSEIINTGILDIKVQGDCVFILTVGKLYILNPSTDSTAQYDVDKDLKCVLPVTEDSVAFVGDERITFLLVE